MVDSAIAALQLLQKQSPELFTAQLKRMQQAEKCAFSQTVIAATLPADRKSANLLPNAGFEKAKPTGEPLHWVSWGSVPDKFTVDKKGGRNGGNAARVNYNVGAAYMHYHQVKPGEKYVNHNKMEDVLEVFKDVQRITQCSTGCGGCYEKVLDVISEIMMA